ncbi:MAG: hypothetical protein JSS32_08220 [Verrucomicrobia bacterium]|nr:hypothetical protein [Verrucomicrobiota bacterium]
MNTAIATAVGAITYATGAASPPVALGAAIATFAAANLWTKAPSCRKKYLPNEALIGKFQRAVKIVSRIRKLVARHKELSPLRKYDLQSIANRGDRKLAPLKTYYISHRRIGEIRDRLNDWEAQFRQFEITMFRTDALSVLYSFLDHSYLHKNSSWAIAEDAEGNWRAFAVCDFNSNRPELTLLVSSPENFENPAQRGAASALLSHIVRTALHRHAAKLILKPTTTGRPYYRHQGFVEDVNNKGLLISSLNLLKSFTKN